MINRRRAFGPSQGFFDHLCRASLTPPPPTPPLSRGLLSYGAKEYGSFSHFGQSRVSILAILVSNRVNWLCFLMKLRFHYKASLKQDAGLKWGIECLVQP